MGKQICAHARTATDHLLVEPPRENSYVFRPRVADNGNACRASPPSFSFKRGARPSAFGTPCDCSGTSSSQPGTSLVRERVGEAKAMVQAAAVQARAEAVEAVGRERADRATAATQRRAAQVREARLKAQQAAKAAKAAGAGRPTAARNGGVARAHKAHFAHATADSTTDATAAVSATATAAATVAATATVTAAAAEKVLASLKYMMGLARKLQAQGRFDEAAALLSAGRNAQ